MKKTPLFTSGERMVAGLAIVTTIVLTLSIQVIQSMTPPSLGLYDADPASMVAIPNVIEARPAL
jgi:lipopolysaccharide export LptBFGC system permease protein LptF